MSEQACDVLIVGAGPTGLCAACELIRHGLSCRIVEQRDAIVPLSKALGVQARSLELFEDMGLVDDALARGRILHGASVYSGGRRIVRIRFDELDASYPFVLILPQFETERLLAERLTELGGVIERERCVEDFTQDHAGVTARIVSPTGAVESIRSRWLIGCDGAHSTVRKTLGLSFEGLGYEETFVLADLRIEGALTQEEIQLFLNPEGMLAVFPLPEDGVFRLVADITSRAEDVPEKPPLGLFEELLARRGPAGARLSDARWRARFRIHRRMVPRYRVGRCFLAGDAAHIHSPAGGQGMNTGLQDSYNLAWKLALVTRGRARPELLDSYDTERRPIAAMTLKGTDLATRVVTLRNPLSQALRNHLAGFLSSLEVVQRRITNSLSELSLNYRESPIVAEHRPTLLTIIRGDDERELPSFSEGYSFGSAPHCGDRAPDTVISEKPLRRLFPLLHGTKHSLLLFDGQDASAAGYERLGSVAAQVVERYPEQVTVHIIVPADAAPAQLDWNGSLVLDGAAFLHWRYGAASECLYLIRPDGYIAYRSQPIESEKLFEYLASIFDAQPEL